MQTKFDILFLIKSPKSLARHPNRYSKNALLADCAEQKCLSQYIDQPLPLGLGLATQD